MIEPRDLRTVGKAYVTIVVVAGLAIIAYSIHRLVVDSIGTQWFVIAALTLLTGSFTVRVPTIQATLSVSETFVFAAVLLFGPSAGVVTVLLECLIILFWVNPHGSSLHKGLFNVAAPAIAIWVSGNAFFLLSGLAPYATLSALATPPALSALFLPLSAFTILYFLLNSSLVAFALGFETGQSPVQIWSKNFIWLSVNYFSGASVAALIVTYVRHIDFSTLWVFIPLLVVSYLTFRTAMGRVSDTNSHLSELNRLHLSTIETLAMAIDAKDQITHGHIRRVQSYAVALATRIGVSDTGLIKAIEAAALLHDMGKLAVPEYILNKPGKLTVAEFEKMKAHATIGADILSAIEFPYPVVPIVRHHHENWDGTGYPAGLKGTDIPIGARILSVVDCFDALISDRPYRPRLSDEEAVAILVERRGKMYDPLIVDAFVRVHKEIAPPPLPVAVPSHVLNEITSSRQGPVNTSSPLAGISASSDEMSTLYELAQAMSGQSSVDDAGDVVVKHLRRLIPFAQSALFLYDAASDELVAHYAQGEASSTIKGLRIALGQRLSGWVAANRQTILNSDPALDLGEAARAVEPRLRSSLSTPLISDNELVGVLTLYSTVRDGFTEDHRRLIGVVSRQTSKTFKKMAEFETSARRDPVTGLPNLKQLERMIEVTSGANVAPRSRMTLLLIDVVHLADINGRYGQDVGDAALRHVVACVRSGLRSSDILFRYTNDELIALLNDANLEVANLVTAEIMSRTRRQHLHTPGGDEVAVEVKLTTLVADGASLGDHLASARQHVHEHVSIH